MAAQFGHSANKMRAFNLIKEYLNSDYVDNNGRPIFEIVQEPSGNILVSEKGTRQKLSFNVDLAGTAAIPWGGPHEAGNRALSIKTPKGAEYILGSTGIGSVDKENNAHVDLFSPVETLGRMIAGSFMNARESHTGSGPEKQFQYLMQNSSVKRNVVGGAQLLTRSQQGTQAPGMLSSQFTFLADIQKGKGAFEQIQKIRSALDTMILRPTNAKQQGLQNLTPMKSSGNITRFAPNAELVYEANPTQSAIVSTSRDAGAKLGQKYLSMGRRNQLTPLIEMSNTLINKATGKEYKEKSYVPYQAQQITNQIQLGNTSEPFDPLRIRAQRPRARYNAVYGNEQRTGADELIPMEALTGLTMVAPTVYSGAGFMNTRDFSEIKYAGYKTQRTKEFEDVPLEDLISAEGGLEIFNNLKAGNVLKTRVSSKSLHVQNPTVGELGGKPVELRNKKRDFIVGSDEGDIRLVIPAQFRDIDFGGGRTGQSVNPLGSDTGEEFDYLQTLQKKLGIPVIADKNIKQPTLMVSGYASTGVAVKGDPSFVKAGVTEGYIPWMENNGVRFRPNFVTEEAKSLPMMMRNTFGLQSYENQIGLLEKLDPELARQVSAKYGSGENAPVLNVPEITQMYGEIQKAKGKLPSRQSATNPSEIEYARMTQTDMFTDMLSRFTHPTTPDENAQNLRRFGIGLTGKQWVYTEVGKDERDFFAQQIKEELHAVYPTANKEQIAKLAKSAFTFRKKKGEDVWNFGQRTEGIVMPGSVGFSEEFSGDFLANYEIMQSVKSNYPKFAKEMGLKPEQGPFSKITNPASKAWSSAFVVSSYKEAKRRTGRSILPTNMGIIDQDKAQSILARLEGATNPDTSDEEYNRIVTEAISGVMPDADPYGGFYFQGSGEMIMGSGAARGISALKFGSDVTKNIKKHGRALEQLLHAEADQDFEGLSEGSLYGFNKSIDRVLLSKNSKSAMRRILGREIPYSGSTGYQAFGKLQSDEIFIPNELLERQGVNIKKLNKLIASGATVPVIAGRFPTLDVRGGSTAQKLVTEQMIRDKGWGDMLDNVFNKDKVFINSLLSGVSEGDWDIDRLWWSLGIKKTKGKGGKYGYKSIMTSDIKKELAKTNEERIADYEQVRSAMGPQARELDVLKSSIRKIFQDPLAVALKSADRDKARFVPQEENLQVARDIYQHNKLGGMSGSYNMRRRMEAVMSTKQSGYGAEHISNMYDTSKYTYQHYLDLSGKEIEGFSPVEEITKTINLSQSGRISGKPRGGKNSGFANLNRGNRWSLGSLVRNEAMNPNASNEFLSYLFGAGPKGAGELYDQIKDINYMAPSIGTNEFGEKFSDFEHMIVNEKQMQKRADILEEAYKQGAVTNASPISKMLTMQTILNTSSKTHWNDIQDTVLPWGMNKKGENIGMKVRDIIKDPEAIAAKTALSIAVKNKGRESVISANDIATTLENLTPGTGMHGMATTLEDLTKYKEARDLNEAINSYKNDLIPELSKNAVQKLQTGEIIAHASDIWEAGVGEEYDANNPALQRILTRSVFGKEVLKADKDVFEAGTAAEEFFANSGSEIARKAGMHSGGRKEKSALYYQRGRLKVEANPDFFNIEQREMNGVITPVPIITEAKSTLDKYYQSIQNSLEGKSGTETTKEHYYAQDIITKAKYQLGAYSKAIRQTKGEYMQARAEVEAAQTPEEKTIASAKFAKAERRAIETAQQLSEKGTPEQKEATMNYFLGNSPNVRPEEQVAVINREKTNEKGTTALLVGGEAYNSISPEVNVDTALDKIVPRVTGGKFIQETFGAVGDMQIAQVSDKNYDQRIAADLGQEQQVLVKDVSKGIVQFTNELENKIYTKPVVQPQATIAPTPTTTPQQQSSNAPGYIPIGGGDNNGGNNKDNNYTNGLPSDPRGFNSINRGGRGGGGGQYFGKDDDFLVEVANRDYAYALGTRTSFNKAFDSNALTKQVTSITNQVLGRSAGTRYSLGSFEKAYKKSPEAFEGLEEAFGEAYKVSLANEKAYRSLQDAGQVETPKFREMERLTSDPTQNRLALLSRTFTGGKDLPDKPTTEMAEAAKKVTETFQKLNTTVDEANKLHGKHNNELDKQLSLDKLNYEKAIATQKRLSYEEQLGAELKKPEGTRIEGRLEELRGGLVTSKLKEEGLSQAIEDTESGQTATRRRSSGLRSLVGGWGLFYMKTLATMGVSEWQKNYADSEQFYNQTQQIAGRTLGADEGVRDDAAIALHRARIRGGAGTFEKLQRAEAVMAGTPLGDISGAGLTGLGFGILSNYAAGPLESTFGLAEGALGGFALPVGLGVSALALGFNRYSAATSQQAPNQIANKLTGLYSAQRNAQGLGGSFNVLGNALSTMWDLSPTLFANPEAARKGMIMGQMAESTKTGGGFSVPTDPGIVGFWKSVLGGKNDTYEAPSTWEDIQKIADKENLSMTSYLQSRAVDEESFPGISPEIAFGVQAEQLAIGGTIDDTTALKIMNARQQGVDTSGLAGSLISQFGDIGQRNPTFERRNALEEKLTNIDLQSQSIYQGGINFLSQLPYSESLKKQIRAGLTDRDLAIERKRTGNEDEGTLKDLATLTKLSELATSPLSQQMAQYQNQYEYGQMYGLDFENPNIMQMQFQTAESIGPIEMNRKQQNYLLNQERVNLQNNLFTTTTASIGDITNFSKQARAGGVGTMNMANLLAARDPYAIAQLTTSKGLANSRPDLISVDVNQAGKVTGLPLYTSYVSGAQAQEIWGNNQNDFTRLATEGVGTKFGTLYGMRALQYKMQDKQWEYQQQSAGIQGAQIALQREYLPKFWDVQDRQRALSYQQQQWSFGQQETSMAMSQRQTQEGWGLQAQGMQMNQQFARQSWAYQDTVRNMQWGWKVEDYEENSRFMTGRQRRLAERQMNRDTTMHNLEGTQIDKQRQQQEETWKLQESQFEMTKKHFAEQQKFQEEALERQKEFYEEGRKLEDESIALSREYQLKQLDLQEAALGMQIQQAKEMHDMQLDYQEMQRNQDDVVSNFQVSVKLVAEFVDILIKAFGENGALTQAIAALSPIDHQGAAGPGTQYPETQALGGSAEYGTVGEAGVELLIPKNGDTIIPMTKLRSPWSDRVISPTQQPVTQDGSLALSLYIGNEYLGKFVIDTVNKELRV